MKSILGVADHTLVWSQPKGLKQIYEFRFGNDLLATLSFPKMLSSLAIAESGDGTFVLERSGFFETKVTIRLKDHEEILATYVPRTFKAAGTITLKNGKTLQLTRNIWQSVHQVSSETGELLFEMKTRGFFRMFADVRINRGALKFEHLPGLVLLTFYLMLMGRRDAATHSAVH